MSEDNGCAWLWAGLVAVVASIASWLYVVPRVWLWYMVPLGVPPITGRMAFGLSLLLLLFRSPATPEKKPARGVFYDILARVAVIWLALLVAWMVRP